MKAGVASAVDALDELGEIAAAGIEALNSGALSTFLAAVDSFADAMERLGKAAGLQILSAEHLELRRLQRREPLEGALEQRFTTAYASVAKRPDRRRLLWYRAGALVRLACVYAFREGWGALSNDLLAAAGLEVIRDP